MRSKHLVHGLAVLGAIALGALSVSPLGAQQASKLRIIQTNYGGDTIHIIDPATNKVVREIKGVEAIHGVVAAPDGNRIYFSEESTNTVVVMDGKTMQITKRIPLSGNPNLIDITPDGKTIYAAISLTYDDVSEFPTVKAGATGGVDVIDTVSLTNIKTIAMKGGVHDLNVTPDGKFVIVGNARGGRANVMTVVDTKTNDVAWTMPMDPSPSPMAVSKKGRWIDRQDLRPKRPGQRFPGHRLCDAQDHPDRHASRHLGPGKEPVRAAGRLARLDGHAGSEDAGDLSAGETARSTRTRCRT